MTEPEVTTNWSIDFEQPVGFELPEWRGDRGERQALEFVANVRALNDPAIVPTSLVREEVTVTRSVTRLPLQVDGPSAEDVAKSVRQRFIELNGALPSGEHGLEWSVKQTMKELGLLNE